MDVQSIVRDFGGKMAFYGGIDVQHLLRLGSTNDVRDMVRYNVKAFEQCGGYLVTNSHHGMNDIKGENIIAMCDEAHKIKIG
jgi:uroporphyrinogen decarboxylase